MAIFNLLSDIFTGTTAIIVTSRLKNPVSTVSWSLDFEFYGDKTAPTI